MFGGTAGVVRTKVGYTGGTTNCPTYRSMGDHTETVELEWDPAVISYEQLLSKFWGNIDPTHNRLKTGCHARQYMTAIFYHDAEQKQLAEISLARVQAGLAKPVVTLVLPAEQFFNAEDYHQKYMLRKHPWLVERLQLTEGANMIRSALAARVNGYLGGEGDQTRLQAEQDSLGLDSEAAAYILHQLPAC